MTDLRDMRTFGKKLKTYLVQNLPDICVLADTESKTVAWI